jgi:hypothetical protein
MPSARRPSASARGWLRPSDNLVVSVAQPWSYVYEEQRKGPRTLLRVRSGDSNTHTGAAPSVQPHRTSAVRDGRGERSGEASCRESSAGARSSHLPHGDAACSVFHRPWEVPSPQFARPCGCVGPATRTISVACPSHRTPPSRVQRRFSSHIRASAMPVEGNAHRCCP